MIIKWIPVNMMNDFVSSQFSSYMLFHNKTVFNNSGFNAIAGCFYGYRTSLIMTFSGSKIRVVFANAKLMMASIRTIFSRARTFTMEILTTIRTHLDILFVRKLTSAFFRTKYMLKVGITTGKSFLKFFMAKITFNSFELWRQAVSFKKIVSIVRVPGFRNDIFTTSTFAFHKYNLTQNKVSVNLISVKF